MLGEGVSIIEAVVAEAEPHIYPWSGQGAIAWACNRMRAAH